MANRVMKLKIEAVKDEEALGQAGASSSPGGHMAQALDHKAAGIQAFRVGRPAEAQEWFKRGLEAALVCRDGQDTTQSEAAAAAAAAVDCLNNSAQVYLTGRQWIEAAEACRQLLSSLDPENRKARFRLCMALIELEEYEEAWELGQALALEEPENAQVLQLMSRLPRERPGTPGATEWQTPPEKAAVGTCLPTDGEADGGVEDESVYTVVFPVTNEALGITVNTRLKQSGPQPRASQQAVGDMSRLEWFVEANDTGSSEPWVGDTIVAVNGRDILDASDSLGDVIKDARIMGQDIHMSFRRPPRNAPAPSEANSESLLARIAERTSAMLGALGAEGRQEMATLLGTDEQGLKALASEFLTEARSPSGDLPAPALSRRGEAMGPLESLAALHAAPVEEEVVVRDFHDDGAALDPHLPEETCRDLSSATEKQSPLGQDHPLGHSEREGASLRQPSAPASEVGSPSHRTAAADTGDAHIEYMNTAWMPSGTSGPPDSPLAMQPLQVVTTRGETANDVAVEGDRHEDGIADLVQALLEGSNNEALFVDGHKSAEAAVSSSWHALQMEDTAKHREFRDKVAERAKLASRAAAKSGKTTRAVRSSRRAGGRAGQASANYAWQQLCEEESKKEKAFSERCIAAAPRAVQPKTNRRKKVSTRDAKKAQEVVASARGSDGLWASLEADEREKRSEFRARTTASEVAREEALAACGL